MNNMIIFLFLVIDIIFTWNLYLLDKNKKLDCEIFNLLQDNNRLRNKFKDIRKEKEKNDYNV